MTQRHRPGSLRHALRVVRHRRFADVCALLLAMLALVAVFAEELASARPILCKFHGHVHVLANVTHPKELDRVTPAKFDAEKEPGDFAVWPLVACGARQPCGPAVAPPLAERVP